MIAYLAADLLWATKIKLGAQSLGIEARPVRTREMLEARLGDSDVRGLVLDLDAGEVAMELLALVRGRGRTEKNAQLTGETADLLSGKVAAERRIKVAVFGPHVEAGRLHAARELGADLVLTRGAMDREMERVLRELEGS